MNLLLKISNSVLQMYSVLHQIKKKWVEEIINADLSMLHTLLLQIAINSRKILHLGGGEQQNCHTSSINSAAIKWIDIEITCRFYQCICWIICIIKFH